MAGSRQCLQDSHTDRGSNLLSDETIRRLEHLAFLSSLLPSLLEFLLGSTQTKALWEALRGCKTALGSDP